MCYAYIIQSELDGSYYKGFTEDPLLRIKRHNNGESFYTSKKMPWKLVYLQELPDKTSALKREKALKKYSHQQIQELIQTPLNMLAKYLSERG